MALINCSECGKEISNKADKCPNCGNPINELRITPSSDKSTSNINGNNEGCFLQTLNIGCVLTVCIIMIIILFLFFISL
jgi:uncharacterized membrane protein YvbJ